MSPPAVFDVPGIRSNHVVHSVLRYVLLLDNIVIFRYSAHTCKKYALYVTCRFTSWRPSRSRLCLLPLSLVEHVGIDSLPVPRSKCQAHLIVSVAGIFTVLLFVVLGAEQCVRAWSGGWLCGDGLNWTGSRGTPGGAADQAVGRLPS